MCFVRVTAVAIGKLWFLFGVEVWGIFNFETFEWRHSNAPPKATIRYGSNSVWLPPYTPFPPSFEVSPLCKALSGLGPRELRTMLRTDLATQYFWLMLQGRRPMDHVHTILLVGGFDAKGQLSNQVDQVLVALPPELATVCFFGGKNINSVYDCCCFIRVVFIPSGVKPICFTRPFSESIQCEVCFSLTIMYGD